MDWNAFQDAHYRPHLVIATLEGTPVIASSDTFALLEQLAATLGLSGNYAIKKDGVSVRAVFEIDTDAERFAGMLQGKTTARETEWASRTVGRIDDVAQKRIVAALREVRLKRTKRHVPTTR
jgi:predicted regulator of Ras-like GTPase activity (Roadblock/LC7/MglB family)